MMDYHSEIKGEQLTARLAKAAVNVFDLKFFSKFTVPSSVES